MEGSYRVVIMHYNVHSCRYDLNALASRMEEAKHTIIARTESSGTSSTQASALLRPSFPSVSQPARNVHGPVNLYQQAIEVLDASILNCKKLFDKYQEKNQISVDVQKSGNIINEHQKRALREWGVACHILTTENSKLIRATNEALRSFNESSLSQNPTMNNIVRGKRSVLERLFIAIQSLGKQNTQESQISSTTI